MRCYHIWYHTCIASQKMAAPREQMGDASAPGCAGSDYSEAAVELARSIAARRGVAGVRWRVDDFLHSAIAERRACAAC